MYQPEPFYLPQAIRELPPLNDLGYISQYFGDAKVKPYCLPPIRNAKKRIVYWVNFLNFWKFQVLFTFGFFFPKLFKNCCFVSNAAVLPKEEFKTSA